MVADLPVTFAIEAGDRIGEGPVWDASMSRLLWIDHAVGVIHEARAMGEGWRETRRWDLQRHLAAVALREGGGLVVATDVEVLLLDDAGALSPFARIDADPALVTMNDAKCDPRGRLWVGTMARDFSDRGGLYRIDPDGQAHTMLQGARLSNGLDWSPDGKTFYFIDTLAMSVDAFAFDIARGELGERRTVVRFEPGAGGANGMAVSRDGDLWVAMTGGGQVRRYSPEGELVGRVPIEQPGPTSCAFGGDGGKVLFITSRSGRMPQVAADVLGIPEAMLESDGPRAGGLWTCRPGVSGAPAARFAG